MNKCGSALREHEFESRHHSISNMLKVSRDRLRKPAFDVRELPGDLEYGRTISLSVSGSEVHLRQASSSMRGHQDTISHQLAARHILSMLHTSSPFFANASGVVSDSGRRDSSVEDSLDSVQRA